MFKDKVAQLVQEALPAGPAREVQVAELIETPPDPKLGDFAFPTFSLARILRKAPPAIAAELAAQMARPAWLDRVEVVGGYLNFFINKSEMVAAVLAAIQDEKEQYGSARHGAGRTVLIEYSSPNIAKPVGVGLLRTTVLGRALARLFAFQGYKVERLNHLGDWGTQCGKWIVAYEMWGDEEKLRANPLKELYQLYVRFHQEAEANPELEDRARAAFLRLEQGDPAAHALWQRFRDLSIEELKQVYARMGVEFDSYAGEAFYEDKMPAVVEMLRERGLLKESEGATIVELGDLPPCMIQRSDGATLYATRDLAAAIYRWEHYQPLLALYVVGIQQSLHFQQVFGVLRRAGCTWVDRYEHVPFGYITLGGEAMSTRRGNVVFLEDVLDEATARALAIMEERNPNLQNKEKVAAEVGMGAVVFRFLVYNRLKDISFDWDMALNFDGDTGPYVQYTYARAGSVLRKAGVEIKPVQQLDIAALNSPEEIALIKALGQFPAVVLAAEEAREPAGIARYLLDLCRLFNAFYHVHRVVGSDLMHERLAILAATRTVIANGLYLLGIAAPEEM